MSSARTPRPILVTGSHRSGSTWLGQMIGASDVVGYVHEPFNIDRGPGICRTRFPYWFTYIRPGTDGAIADDFRRLLDFRYNYLAQAVRVRSKRDVRVLIRDGGHFLRYRMRHLRPLVKDPMALFSAEWIAETFDAQVVVVVRHPAAFASSLKLDGWTHPFSHFLNQPALIEDYLSPSRRKSRHSRERSATSSTRQRCSGDLSITRSPVTRSDTPSGASFGTRIFPGTLLKASARSSKRWTSHIPRKFKRRSCVRPAGRIRPTGT